MGGGGGGGESVSSQVSEGPLPVAWHWKPGDLLPPSRQWLGAVREWLLVLKDHLPYAALTRLKRDKMRLTRAVRRRQRGSHIQPLQETHAAVQPGCLQK